MKRFGLRALAGTLATLMVVSAFGPAKAASASDIILIAPNPNKSKTLYITEDMVDEDGEIVISGGSYDRVVVAKEVAAKDIYFDQVTVGEMVVESGGESRIQLWEVDAEQVTVQEPELEALSLLDIKDLLKDEETRAIALQMYKESKEKDAKTKKAAPKIVTKEDAQVETLVARANVTLDLAEGEVSEVALEGSEKVDRAKVTLKNYNGDVSFKGTEGKSNTTLNNVDSRIKTLKVEESNANNYFAVNARNSVVLKAEVAGNARFALNALTGALEVTEEATAANITLLNTIEEMNIAGDNAVIDVAPCGRVETAAITGDKANVSGSGTLVAVDITGEGAYVSTFGTAVEGENTYVPPVYVEPVYDSWSEDFSDETLEKGVPTDGGSMNWATYEYDAENGYGIAHTTAGWQGFAILLDNRDNGSYASYVISLKAKKLGGITNAVRVSENLPDNSWPTFADVVAIGDDWVTIKTNKIGVAAGEKRIILIVPEVGDPGVTMDLAVDDIKVERYTEWTEPKGPEISKEAYTVSEYFTKNVGAFKGRGDAKATVVDGAMHVSGRTDNWHGVEISLNKEKTIGRTLNVSFKAKWDDETAGTVKSTVTTSGSTYLSVASTEKIAKADEWVTVTGSVSVPVDAEYVTYYFEADSKTASFYIDDVVISTEEITDDMLTEPDDGDDNHEGSSFAETKTYVAGDLSYTVPSWNPGTTATANDDHSVTVAYAGDYHETRFQIPDDITAGQYEKIVVTASGSTINSGVELLDSEGQIIAFWWGKAATEKQEIELTYDTLGYAANTAMTEEQLAKKIAYVSFKNAVESQTGEITVHSIKFVGTEPEKEKITEFYLVENKPFDVTAVAQSWGTAVTLDSIPLNWWQSGDASGNNFVSKLPESLQNDAEKAKKFTNLTGIVEVVDYFEVSVVLTQGKPTSPEKTWEPQAQIQVQTTTGEATWDTNRMSEEQKKNTDFNIGAPEEGTPKTASGRFYTSYFKESFTVSDEATMNWIQLQFINANTDTNLVGTYSVKVVLK